MPYLRFSRDKRGYENTYVLHTFRGKRGPEPRLLYWFRTPPGARVGRHPLDEEAIRAIEAGNPGLEFDWGEMLKVKPPPRPPEHRRSKPRPAKKKPPESTPTGERAAREESPVVAADEEAPAVEAPEAMLHSAALEDDRGSVPDGPWEHPVAELMGEDMLARLRARYAEVEACIAGRELDPGVRDAVLARAAALDPDGWETLEDAVLGIERFEPEADAVMAMLDAPAADDHGE